MAAASEVYRLEIAVVGYELKVFKTYKPACKKPRRIRVLLAGEHYMALLGKDDKLKNRLETKITTKGRHIVTEQKHQFQSLNEPKMLTQ